MIPEAVEEHTPYVRYGKTDSTQLPRLHRIDEPIPDEATTVSPIYLLTQRQIERHRHRRDNPYAVRDAKTIAKELQDECEDAGRVIYPIFIESDELFDEGAPTLIEWLTEFLERLEVPVNEATWYYSGNRSIHAHTNRFVVGEGAREHIKDLAKQFNDETDAELDTGIYSKKRQFRLPGVNHSETGHTKVEIDPEWPRERIAQEMGRSDRDRSLPFTSDLRGYSRLRFNDTDIEKPLVEQKDPPDEPDARQHWGVYNNKEFSPYANAGRRERSVAVVRVCGGEYARDGVRNGATLVPSYFYAARGCGGEFSMHHQHAPLQLSIQDYEKWEYETGDVVVIIGGKSNNSRIFEIGCAEAVELRQEHLHPEQGSRDDALAFLEARGYDIGSPGPIRPGSQPSQPAIAADGGETRAQKLQEEAESVGINTLSHNERLRVAARLLRIGGWSRARSWFREQLGDAFDPQTTWTQLRSVVDEYPSLQQHVTVPPEPS